MYKPFGVIPAMVTTFKDDFTINEKAYRETLNFYINAGCHGLGVAAGTGEYARMSLDQRKQAMRIAVDEVAGRVPIIAGTGCHGTDESVELSQYADSLGIEACLVITPYYTQTNDDGIYRHYKTISDSVSNTGIVIYNFPAGTNVNINPDLVAGLAKEKNIVGIKNSTPDFIHQAALIHKTRGEDFNVITGYESLLLPTLLMGGRGIFAVAPDIIPREMVGMYELAMRGDFKGAVDIHDKYYDMYQIIWEEPSPGPAKAALELLGFEAGPPRPPVFPVTDGYRAKLKSLMQSLEILK